jgi:TolB-like protein
MLRRHLIAGLTVAGMALSGCASTSSTMIPATSGPPQVAIVQLEGPLGEQAVDLISQELAMRGIAVVERARTREVVALDTDLSETSPATVDALSSYGEQLGVRYLFTGTVSAEGGPLYSFDHVNMTLRLIDVRTGQTRWIGRYGNAMWTSAISQQGDLQRGAKHIVDEFINAGGARVLNE